METDPDGASRFMIDPTSQIQQEVGKNQGQAIGQMVGGLAIGQLTVYLAQLSSPTDLQSPSPQIGANPYRGLRAFYEEDGDRFFGRETEIEGLWQRFWQLHQDESAIRVLPIYGPSGSGKSSLARAGLIPALGKRTLPGRDRARVVVFTPSGHPLESLATGLARIVTADLAPVAKTREFRDELFQCNTAQEYDGLRRIADVLPDIAISPLIVLVDQFEEIYTLCTDPAERNAFVENLLHAAADRSQRVSVILTLRSDFLGETQQHPRLNKLFSAQGFLVPIMQPEELELAITKPAEQAGYKLDRAIVQLLIEQTEGQDGALPLLQFALTRIWEGLQSGIDPAETLEQIGGVGGALAGEAQKRYADLSMEDQEIARCIFLALVQVGEDSEGTRRRAALSELIPNGSDGKRVREIIRQFAQPGVWIIETSFDQRQGETIEVAHEALIRNWEQLKEWLKECREGLRQKRKIEQLADEWKQQGKPKGYLLQGRPLRDAKEFMQVHKANSETALSNLANDFVKASLRKQQQGFLKIASLFAVLPLMGTLTITHFFLLNLAQTVINKDDSECKQDREIPIVIWYLTLVGQKENLEEANFCNDVLNGLDLSGATLWRTNFKFAHLAETNLQGTNLQEANFHGSNLLNTDFSDALLEDANFEESIAYKTNFETAKGLQQSQLETALLCNARLPRNFTLNSERDCEELKQRFPLAF